MNYALVDSGTRRGVLTLVVDEEPVASVHTSIVGKRFRLPCTLTDRQALDSFVANAVEAGAKRYCLWRLSKTSMSVHKLREALIERLVPEDVCQTIIAEHIRLGFLNDEAYIQQVVRRKKRTLCGSGSLKWASLKQGIDPELAQNAYEASTTPEEEIQAILKFAGKRKSRPQTIQERRKCIQALLRRGFSYGRIQEALNRESI